MEKLPVERMIIEVKNLRVEIDKNIKEAQLMKDPEKILSKRI